VELYPAVDIEGGRVARAHGSLSDPLEALAEFTRAGTRWIHLVDMDRAYGRTDNHELIEAVLRAARVRVQVGGGLSTEIDIDHMFTLGATRVVMGARGAVDSGLVERLMARHGADRLAVGIDAKAGRVAPRGTGAELLAITAQDLARRVAGLGARTVIYNEVTRDGMLQGPDIEGAKSLAAAGVEVIVSGGVGSLDLRAVKAARLAGACVGRALYDGKFTVREALACLS